MCVYIYIYIYIYIYMCIHTCFVARVNVCTFVTFVTYAPLYSRRLLCNDKKKRWRH